MRLCLIYAFDYERLTTEVLGGQAERRASPLPSHFPYAPTAEQLPTPQRDPEQAEAHCRAAHGGQAWQHGFRLRAAQNGNYARFALDLLAQNLTELNPKFVVESVQTEAGAEAALSFVGFRADAPEPDSLLRPFYRSGHAYADQVAFDGSSDLDRLLDTAQLETDPDRRAELYAEALAAAEAQHRYLWLPVPNEAAVLSQEIEATSGQQLHTDTVRLWKNLRRE